MKTIRNSIIIIFTLHLIALTGGSVYAQKSSVRATVSHPEIMIGEHDTINLEVISPKGRNILFPMYPDTLITGIEVLGMLPADTIIAHDVMTITQRYIITSFDSTLYYIPHMLVIDGQDTIKSNGFGLKVTSLMLPEGVLANIEQMIAQQNDSIDFEALQLTDITANMKPPFVWQDYLVYLWVILGILLVLVLLGVGLYLILRKKKKGYFFKPEVVLPPHIVAIKALDHIKAEKKWQHGLEKQYYTEVTDILREYIEKRFMISAFEKTSDEILDAIKLYTEADSSIDSLQQILKLADLVKFAKYKPLANENDLSLMNSYLFVNQTKIEPKPIEGDAGNETGNKTHTNNTEPGKANS